MKFREHGKLQREQNQSQDHPQNPFASTLLEGAGSWKRRSASGLQSQRQSAERRLDMHDPGMFLMQTTVWKCSHDDSWWAKRRATIAGTIANFEDALVSVENRIHLA